LVSSGHALRPCTFLTIVSHQLYRETDKKGTSSNANAQSASNESPLLVSDPANTSPPSRKDSTTSLSRPKDGRAQADRNRERALVGSLTNSYKFKPDGMMKKVSLWFLMVASLGRLSGCHLWALAEAVFAGAV
jgi:hypothetical protein